MTVHKPSKIFLDRNVPKKLHFFTPCYRQLVQICIQYSKILYTVAEFSQTSYHQIVHNSAPFFFIPYRPLTFDFFPQKCPFLSEPAIFIGGDPAHSIPQPQKPIGGSHFHGGHGHGSGAKRQKHGWTVYQKKVKLSTFS
jgi:hypothetical protein